MNEEKKDITQSNKFYIDTESVQKDLKILFQSPKMKKKWDNLVKSLQENPYRLPPQYIPRDGLKYNKKYHGYDLYHAVIDKSEKDRLFYIVKNGVVIISEIQYKGIVELIQSLGHDF